MIRWLAIAATAMACTAARADSCSLMLFKDDLPECVRQLNSKIFLLEAELRAEQSEKRLYQTVVCNLAHAVNKTNPSEDAAAIAQAACAIVDERLAAKRKRPAPTKP